MKHFEHFRIKKIHFHSVCFSGAIVWFRTLARCTKPPDYEYDGKMNNYEYYSICDSEDNDDITKSSLNVEIGSDRSEQRQR